MRGEQDEVALNYLVLCDHVITEAGTNKQSIIGIYSVIYRDPLPMEMDFSVALGVSVQSAVYRRFHLTFSAPDGSTIICTPELALNWELIAASLDRFDSAAIQMVVCLNRIPLHLYGVYTAAMHCDEQLLGTYHLTVASPNVLRLV